MKVKLILGLAFALIAAFAIYFGIFYSGSPSVGNDYVATGAGSATLIQWSPTGGMLDGTMTLVTLSGTPPNQTTSTQSVSISGTVNGSTIGVSVDAGVERFGTLSGDAFDVDVPENDGTLISEQFASGTSSAFNQVVSRLQDQAQAANARYERATGSANKQLDSQCRAAGGNIRIRRGRIDNHVLRYRRRIGPSHRFAYARSITQLSSLECPVSSAGLSERRRNLALRRVRRLPHGSDRLGLHRRRIRGPSRQLYNRSV